MSVGASIVWISIVAVFGVFFLAVLALKTLSVFFNSQVGHQRRDHTVHESHRQHSGSGTGLLFGVVVAFAAVSCLILFAARIRTVQSAESAAADADMRETMRQLSEARSGIRDTLQTSHIRLPAEPAATQSDAVLSTAAADSAIPATVISADVEAVAESSAAEPVAPATRAATGSSGGGTEERQRRRSELSGHIRNWIRSLFEETSQQEHLDDGSARAAESANGAVVVLQLSGEMAEKLLGESGQEMLESFNIDLPERIRQTYALIPLTPPVETAVSPMRPLLAAGGLEAIADSLVSIVQGAVAQPVERAGSPPPAVALSTAPAIRPMPTWVRSPDGGRIVAETKPLAPGEDPEEPLLKAINQALLNHMRSFAGALDPALDRQAGLIRLELDQQTAARCIVDRYERVEIIDAAGPQPMRKIYALVEFPESVDIAALQTIRQSVQHDRIAGLGIIVAAVWLSVVSAGCGVRLWNRGTRVRRLTAVPLIGIVSVPLLLSALGFGVVLARNGAPRPIWTKHQPPLQIHVAGPAER